MKSKYLQGVWVIVGVMGHLSTCDASIVIPSWDEIKWSRALRPPRPTTCNRGSSSMQELDGQGPAPSIVAVAAVQFLGSLPFLYVCGIALWGTIWTTHDFANWPMLVVGFGLPFLFSLVAIVTSIGLLRLREWARRATLYLATLPVSGCALFLILHQQEPYDVPLFVGKASLAILIPISIWWWVLFTRNTVRSQFYRH